MAALQAEDPAISATIFAPQHRNSSAQVQPPLSQHRWQRGQSPSLQEATGNVVWLQHHFAFYELDRALLREVQHARRQGKGVYITLHTTRPIIDFDTNRRRTVAATLAAFDRVFVHTLDDLNYLKRIGLTDNVTQLPQGVDTCQNPPAASDSQAPIIGSFGFLLPHKGVNTLIEAFAALRKKEVLPAHSKLRLVNSVRDEPSSQEELARCQRTSQRLGVENHIEWITDFLPLEDAQRYLAECSVAVLPYQYTQESSSAAVRTAVAACPNILTTPAPIFDEVKDAVWQTQGFDSQHIAEGITNVLHASEEQRNLYHQAREQWLSQRSWQALGQRYVGLLKAGEVEKQLKAQSHA